MQPGRTNSGSPRRILIVGGDLSTGGGVNKVIRDLAALFAQELDAEVTVVGARSDEAPTYPFPSGVRIERYRHQSLPAFFGLLLGLRRRRFDIVISQWTQDNLLVALAFALSHTKVVLMEHAPWHFHRSAIRAARRLIYPLASAVVVLNRNDLAYYRRFVRDVRLIPNPIAATPARVPDSREPLVLAIGHLEPLKQFDHALRAMATSGIEEQGWSLTVIGSGRCERELRTLADELGLRKTTFRTGWEDLEPWYARASLLLVPSRMESFSLVLAEAMAAGVVPIAYASDGPSMILEEFPAQLVPCGDVDALAATLRPYAENTEMAALRTKLSQSVTRRFDPAVVLTAWKQLLGLRQSP